MKTLSYKEWLKNDISYDIRAGISSMASGITINFREMEKQLKLEYDRYVAKIIKVK